MRIPVTDLLSIQEESREQDKEKRYGPVVVSLIQITEKIFSYSPPPESSLLFAPGHTAHAARPGTRTDAGARCPMASVLYAFVWSWPTQISAGGSGGYLLVASCELQERAKNAGAETETEEHVRT